MAATGISNLQLEAVQTVMPSKPTDPRQPISVHFEEYPSCSGILKRCFNVVLCYKEERSTFSFSGAGDAVPASGSLVAAWIKESLAVALSEQPILAGRLRRKDDSGEFEMVPNDSGVRLVEMKIGMSLDEFLDMKVKNDAESQLIDWEDLEHNPQYSPLFYVQVTNYTCGGYSIGISCSTLLTDPFSMMSFLHKWTDIHINILSKINSPNFPIFYRQNHINNGIRANSPSLPFGANAKTPNAGQSAILTIKNGEDSVEKIAAICIDGEKSNFSSVLVKELVSGNEVKVRNYSRKELNSLIENNQKEFSMNINGEYANWSVLGAQEMCFQEGNKPVHVSCWISSVSDEAFLMIVNQDSGVLKAVITLPLDGDK